MSMNLEYYKIFYYVTKYGSFTSAAEELCISQPAISQGIRNLEAGLGCSLFVRTKKGVKLTPDGELLYNYVSRGYENILLGESKLKKRMDLESGEIRIGASDMTLQFYLLSFLEEFHKLYPKIKVTVTNAPTPETIKYLYEDNIDFGVVSDPFSAKSDIKVTKVGLVEDIFVAGNQFISLKDQILELKDLENLPIICLEKNTSTRAYMNEFLEANKVLLEPEFELATSEMIVQFSLRNLGIGSVVYDFAKKHLESGELFQLKFNKEIPKRNFCIIQSDNNPISFAAKKLLDMMVNIY